jgi:hypothetical protein
MRSEPSLDQDTVLIPLPSGTRVRVVDSRDRWVKIRVLEYPPGYQVTGAPSEGWVDIRFVRFD